MEYLNTPNLINYTNEQFISRTDITLYGGVYPLLVPLQFLYIVGLPTPCLLFPVRPIWSDPVVSSTDDQPTVPSRPGLAVPGGTVGGARVGVLDASMQNVPSHAPTGRDLPRHPESLSHRATHVHYHDSAGPGDVARVHDLFK